jgi:tungstate transport system ATP-binding protein
MGHAPAAATAAIRMTGVGLRAGRTRILDGIDLAIASGKPTLMLGPNGAGKTTLLKLMMALADPTEGQIAVMPQRDGTPVRRAFVFQKPVMLKRTAAANIAFALTAAGRRADASAITRLLEWVRLAGMGNRPARRLSAGEQQRLALARALARDPDILFLDEPTASLDPAQTRIVEEIVRDVAASGVKVVMATHDLGQARRIAGDIVFLAAGRVLEHTPAEQFFRRPASVQAQRFVTGELIM